MEEKNEAFETKELEIDLLLTKDDLCNVNNKIFLRKFNRRIYILFLVFIILGIALILEHFFIKNNSTILTNGIALIFAGFVILLLPFFTKKSVNKRNAFFNQTNYHYVFYNDCFKIRVDSSTMKAEENRKYSDIGNYIHKEGYLIFELNNKAGYYIFPDGEYTNDLINLIKNKNVEEK